MIEIELNGGQYRLEPLDAMRQFHLSRRLAPIIPTLLPAFLRLQEGGLDKDVVSMAEALVPAADAIANMDDEAAEYVIGLCLSSVRRQQRNTWAPIWKSGQCMFDDIGLDLMLRLVAQVIASNLGPFIQGVLTSQSGTPA